MKILAVETSCDETAIAIADFSGTHKNPAISIGASLISSQIKLHKKFGGVVPNLARRAHEKNLVPLLCEALREARITNQKSREKRGSRNSQLLLLNSTLKREPELLEHFKKKIMPLAPPPIDAVAVTYGPGLAPALWVGVNFAKALATLWKKPLIPVNHMAGHFYSAFLQKSGASSKFSAEGESALGGKIQNPKFPILGLLVSGGHTELVLAKKHGKFKIIGETLDDAAGEAFDKVARLLGLGYPGGPEISRLAEKGNPQKYSLPRPMIHSKDYNFSFSGLKTAVLYFIRDHPRYSKKGLAASFEKAVVDVLIKKTIRAVKEYKIKTILLGGGVAANEKLRSDLGRAIKREFPGAIFVTPEFELTGDNALMIAIAAYFSGHKKDPKSIGADANLRIDRAKREN